MKRGAVFTVAILMLCTVGCSASSHDFNSVVSGVEHRYSIHAQRIPLMGFVSFCARVTTLGGVKGMRIAQFEGIHHLDAANLSFTMQSSLGPQWQPMVVDWDKEGTDVSVIFVQPDGRHSMRMLVASYDGDELNLVRMDLNGPVLAHWMREPSSRIGPLHHVSDVHPGRTD